MFQEIKVKFNHIQRKNFYNKYSWLQLCVTF